MNTSDLVTYQPGLTSGHHVAEARLVVRSVEDEPMLIELCFGDQSVRVRPEHLLDAINRVKA
jgi:hypothetical protein